MPIETKRYFCFIHLSFTLSLTPSFPLKQDYSDGKTGTNLHKTKVLQMVYHGCMEELFWFLKEPLLSYSTFTWNKELFSITLLTWKGSSDVKGTLWNLHCFLQFFPVK